jgi:hypothetical protein
VCQDGIKDKALGRAAIRVCESKTGATTDIKHSVGLCGMYLKCCTITRYASKLSICNCRCESVLFHTFGCCITARLVKAGSRTHSSSCVSTSTIFVESWSHTNIQHINFRSKIQHSGTRVEVRRSSRPVTESPAAVQHHLSQTKVAALLQPINQ